LRKRKILLVLSLTANLSILGFFKYYNFFIDSFVDAFSLFGMELSVSSLNIILPVGISFYTFQTLSYTIDVYRKKLEPTRDIIAFFAFVSFFPQLVAGPIERATSLLPQFYSIRTFDWVKARDGLRQIMWGLFKKMVIADNCGNHVNMIFDNYESLGSGDLLLGTVFFAFQIYGDFSGYSDIAIGTARLFGFNLMQNFAFPYFSRDIAEFWRRWHISLSTWFRDYLYIPLGGSRVSTLKVIRNVFVIFLVSGFWHGANWTYIAWGFLNALYFLPLLLKKRNRVNLGNVAEGRLFVTFRELLQVVITFLLICLAWVFFRAETITQAIEYLYHMFTNGFSTIPVHMSIIPLISLLVIMEWFQRHKQHGLEIDKIPLIGRYVVYMLIIIFLVESTTEVNIPFIYFQF
jgi:alginate O-acetyltransferase complex protein AlgI